jgi:hypothetical protein
LKHCSIIRPPVAINENEMVEKRKLVSITPIQQGPAPRIELNDKRKRCVHCSSLATNEVLFKQEGVTIIERYCDSCMVSLKIKIKPPKIKK